MQLRIFDREKTLTKKKLQLRFALLRIFFSLFSFFLSSYWCREDWCEGQGMYISDHCHKLRHEEESNEEAAKCALMITDFPSKFASREKTFCCRAVMGKYFRSRATLRLYKCLAGHISIKNDNFKFKSCPSRTVCFGPKPAVLKLGVATLLRVANFQKRVAKLWWWEFLSKFD